MAKLVFTTVPGTYAWFSKWPSERGSLLTTALSEMGHSTVVRPFRWSSWNSHAARLQAAEELQGFLRRLTDKYPRAQHYVVAHSHGGNVALAALRDADIASRIDGLILLATPYLIPRIRQFESTLWFVARAIVFFLSASLLFSGLLSLAFAIDPQAVFLTFDMSSLDEPALTLEELSRREIRTVFVFMALGCVSIAYRVHGWIPSFVRTRVLPRLYRVQRQRLREMSWQIPKGVRLLSISALRDEAARWLRFVSYCGNLPFQLWRPRWIIGGISALLAFFVVGVLFFSPWSNFYKLVMILFGLAFAFPMYLIMTWAIVHLAMLCIGLIARSSEFAFGETDAWTVLLTHVECAARPPPGSLSTIEWVDLRGFRHGRIYNDSAAAELVRSWVEDGAASS